MRCSHAIATVLWAAATLPAGPARAGEPVEGDGVVAFTCCDRSVHRGPTAPACPPGALSTSGSSARDPAAADPRAEGKVHDQQVARDIAAAERACLGRPIGETELQGCIGTRCQDAARRARFLSLTDLSPGRALHVGMLGTARRRLMQTHFFAVPRVFCRVRYGRAHIVLKVKGRQFVRRVRFAGQDRVYLDELHGHLLVQPGDVLEPRTPAGRRLLRRQCLEIAALYHKRGHHDAVVHVRTRAIGIGLVGVQIAIREGTKHRISHYRVHLLNVPVPTDVERAMGLVCRRVRRKEILKVSGLDGVDVFAARLRVKARSRIRRYLRRLGYSRPGITVRHDPEQQLIDIRVRLSRCNVLRIRTREAPGQPYVDVSDDSELLGALTFAESGIFDLDEAVRGRHALLAALERRGALFADVHLDFRPVPRASRARVRSAITYSITSGYPAQIRGLRFPGLRHFTMADLEGVVATRRYDFFGDGGFLQKEQMLSDLARLRQFYMSEGFFEFRYKLHRRADSRANGGFEWVHHSEGRQEVWDYLLKDRGFRVRRPDGEPFIYVEVPIEEGRRSRLTRLRIKGAHQIPAAQIRKLMGLREGGVISYRRVLEALHAVHAAYHEQGFFRMRFLLQCEGRGLGLAALGEDKGRAAGAGERTEASAQADRAADGTPWEQGRSENRCSQKRVLAEKVRLELTLDEGRRMRMGEVFISGNFDTEDEVLLRDLPKPGEPFSRARLFEAQRKLRNLSLFDSVSFEYIGDREEPVRDRIAVLVRVTESRSRELQFEAGLQTLNSSRQDSSTNVATTPSVLVDHIEHLGSSQERLLTGFGDRLGVVLPSLLLTGGVNLSERNLLGRGIDLEASGVLGFTIDDSLIELVTPELVDTRLSLVQRRLLGSDAQLRVIAPYYVRDYATITLDIDTFGAAAEISKRFGRLVPTLGLNGAWVRTREVINTARQAFDPFTFQWKIIPRLTRDSTDSPINPTRGTFLSVTAPVIYAQLIDATTGKQTFGSFIKLDATAKWFGRFAGRFVLATMLRLGYAWHFSIAGGKESRRLPANERFRLGGALGLRGFTDGGVPQYDSAGSPVGEARTPDDEPGWKYHCASIDGRTGECAAWALKDDGDMLLSGSVEVRTPTFAGDWLAGALFWDFGGIAENLDSFHAAGLRHGVGVGMRVLISGQLPLRFDVATPLGGRCTQPDTRAGNCTVEDPLQFHIGLLYAF